MQIKGHRVYDLDLDICCYDSELCRATITNQALVGREESSYYYLPLTPRVSLPLPLPSAVQFRMSMIPKSSSKDCGRAVLANTARILAKS